jgi:hypothetical protein
MDSARSFSDQIRERYPEGLTGIFAPGGTRTTFILERQRNQENPGLIRNYTEYADYGLDRLFSIIETFFDLGVQNLIIPLFSYQGFYERGPEYADKAARLCLQVIQDERIAFYRQHQVDPYYVGIDTLQHLPADQFAHQLGVELENFQRGWSYQDGRRKLIWEVAPIPLFSFWRAHQVMGAAAQRELEENLQQSTDMRDMHDKLYRYYARAVYGTDVPMAHFYLAANRNGDIKMRSMLPMSLICGGPFRMFFTPYPSLFLTREVIQAILEDLAFGKAFRSHSIDYNGLISADLLEAEYQRILSLSADPGNVVGMIRKIPQPD